MSKRSFYLPTCGFRALDGTTWVNAPTADTLLETLFPFVEEQCPYTPDREFLLSVLERHYPLTDTTMQLTDLIHILLSACREEEL